MKHYTEYTAPAAGIYKFKGENYSDVIFTFDIETTNYNLTDGTPAPYMYIWQLGVNDTVYYGRTWSEMTEFLTTLHNTIHGTFIIFVHNLAFEFSYLQNVYNDWQTVFARTPHKPIYARRPREEWRCTLMLTNLSLAQIPAIYKLPVEKMVGDLDYSLIRTPRTHLTAAELKYCEYDCLVVYYLIVKMSGEYETPANIPHTQTGEVRRQVKERMKPFNAYSLNPHSVAHWDFFRKVYAGGYTHSNWLHTRVALDNVKSVDKSSSYPHAMMCRKFPMTPFSIVPRGTIDVDSVINTMDNTAYMLHVRLYNIKSTFGMSYLSASKCINIKGGVYDNGRILKADYLETWLTELDLDTLCKVCDIGACKIVNALSASKDYLPPAFVKYCAELYTNKTKLKGLNDDISAAVYMKSKQLINSMYGLTVTNTIVDDVNYTPENGWTVTPLTPRMVGERLNDYTAKHSYLSVAWGIYVSAYARHDLWELIRHIGNDVVYCDTDSVKYINNHDAEIAEVNAEIDESRINAERHFNIDLSPCDVKGIAHPLGAFEIDGAYTEFKTLGAKKYAYKETPNGEIHITVAGVPKKAAALVPSLDDFDDGFVFRAADLERVGAQKLCHIYAPALLDADDNTYTETITDYTGVMCPVEFIGGCHLHSIDYAVGITNDYINVINHVSASRWGEY